MAQVVGNLTRISLLAHAKAAWLGIDFCGVGKNLPAHFLVYDLLIHDVVVGKDPEADQAHDQEDRDEDADNRAGKALTNALHARKFDLYGQLVRRNRPHLSDAWRARALPAGALSFCYFFNYISQQPGCLHTKMQPPANAATTNKPVYST